MITAEGSGLEGLGYADRAPGWLGRATCHFPSTPKRLVKAADTAAQPGVAPWNSLEHWHSLNTKMFGMRFGAAEIVRLKTVITSLDC